MERGGEKCRRRQYPWLKVIGRDAKMINNDPRSFISNSCDKCCLISSTRLVALPCYD
jgi:hypothetical protein